MFHKLTQNNATAIRADPSEFRQKFHVFRIVSYQLNYVSKDPQTHRKVYLDHLEQFGISFKNFVKKVCGRFRVFHNTSSHVITSS